MAFALNLMGVSAQMQTLYGVESRSMIEYGVYPIPELTIWDKILSIILSPIVVAIVIVLAFAIGVIIFIKRKGKHVKKNP